MMTRDHSPCALFSFRPIGLAALAVCAAAPASAQTLSALTPPSEPAPRVARSAPPLPLTLGGLPPSVVRQAFGAQAAPARTAAPRARPVKAAPGTSAQSFPKIESFGAGATRGIQFGTLTFEDETHRYDANAYRRQGPVY